MRKLWADFKAFTLKGNLLDLAIAVVLGIAFNAVVQSLVDDLLTPLIAAAVGEPDFSALTLTVGEGVIRYGVFLTALANLLIVAFSLFLVVKAYQRATRARAEEPPTPSVRVCPHCATDISVKASRCPNCTSEVEPQAA